MTGASPAWAAVVNVGPGDDVEGAINAAQPGDEIVLAGGMYTLTERFSFDIAGTEGQPIIIRAADGEQPHLHRPDAAQNIVDIDGATWVEIRGIEFSGGSAGIRISAADHLTIEDCEIHDTADVALRANDGGVTYESLHIVHNHIHDTDDTGEGMYLGCNNDGCRLANSVIERNWVHHTNGPMVVQGDGIEIKEGSYGNVIRDNVIHDTKYPCILTYSTAGNGPPNVIERNVLWNCGDHGIQSAADATIRNNIILSANVDGIAMQMHQSGSPDNLEVVHNTIVKSTNDAISLRNAVGDVLIANNAVYAQSGSAIFFGAGDTSGVILAGNVGIGGVSGGPGGGYVDGDPTLDLVDGHFGGAPPIDVFPAPGGALIGAGDPAYVTADDFNTTPRGGVADVGAYLFDPEGNPGWPLAPEFKDFPDGGGSDTDGGTGDTGSDGTGGVDETGGNGSLGDTGTGGAGSEAGDGTGGATEGTGGTGGSAGGGDGEGGGCGCRSTDRAPLGGAMLMMLLGFLARRRR
ncbi:right-handed parallel beta-helix repeat-containing protein [Paraliomyxa miuraensis]|uniref:right-handed parallel beta-helix repeat-containing protein n=1 Tax=Paraliomyxa miuraensis TaxID=376150 RepID=UPI002253273F|nr:right-handed parallel beta-helix repeat-containing protein [Paraliomyxa miuraensis]MCX4246463.1 right-handed parallel beta-helix repeat-containing protein [Paraliomyxa miuraensis]